MTALALPCGSLTTQAANQTWTGASNTTWESSGNWNSALPSASDIAVWDGAGSNLSITLGSPESVMGLKVLSPSGAITLSGSALTIGTSGIDMSAATQNLTINSALTLGLGNQTWNVKTGQVLTIGGAISRSAGATLLIDKSTNTGTVTASPSLTNGVVPWAIVNSAGSAANNSANGYTWATVTSGNMVPYTGATAVTTGYPANSAATNYDWSAVGTQGQIGSSRSANTIRFTGASAVTQTTNSPQTETFNSLMNAGGGVVTLGGGQTMNIQPAAGELVLAAMTSGIVINGPIVNNGSTPTVLTILGGSGQSVTLSGASSFTGNLVVNSGSLLAGLGLGDPGTATSQTSALGNIGTSVSRSFIVNNGGTLSLTAGNTLGTGASTNTLSGVTLVVNQGGVFQTGLNGSSTGWWNKIGAVNLNGGTIHVGSGANTSSFQGLALIGNVTVGGSAPSTIDNFAASNSASNGIHLGQNGTAGQSITFNVADVTGNSATDLTVAAKLLNTSSNLTASGLTKTGAGTMTLTATSAYTGATTISAGTLQIGDGTNDGSIATSSAITDNGALVYNLAGSQSYANPISGTGILTKSGAGTLTLSGNNSYSGATNVNVGTLKFSGTASIGSVAVADNAAIGAKVTSPGTSVLTASGLTLGSSGTSSISFDFNGLANPTVSVIALGSGTLTRNGTVNVSLANLAGLSSATDSLALMSYGAEAGSGLFNLLTSTLGHTTYSLHDTANALYLNINATTNVWTGATNGTWDIGTTHNWSLSDQVYLAGDKVLFDDTAVGNTSVDLAANVDPVSVTFNNSSQDYAISSVGGFGIVAGNITKGGAGALTLSSSNSYSGGTTLNAGKLNVNNASALGTGAVTITGGTLDNTSGGAITLSTNNAQNWNGDFAFAGSNDLNMGNGNVTLGGSGATRTVTVNGGTLTVGKISGVSAGAPTNFTKDGAGTLAITTSAASSISGTLTVANGTLQMNTGANAATTNDFLATGLAGSGTIVNGGGVERWLIITNSGTDTFNGTMANGSTGALGFSKQGTGTVILNGNNTYTGATTVGGGTLLLAGNNTYTGATNIGGGGLLKITGANTGAGTNVTVTGSGALLLGNTQALGSASLINLSGGTTICNLTYATDGGDTTYQLGMSSGATYNIVLDRATAGGDVTHNLSTLASAGGLGSGTVNFSAGSNVGGTAIASFDRFNLGGGSGGTTLVVPGAGTKVSIGTVTKSNNASAQTIGLDGVTTGNEITGGISNGLATISVAKSNSSTWRLLGANTYTGSTTITGGTLQLGDGTTGHDGTIANTSGVTLSNGATLAYNYSSAYSGTASYATSGTGNLALSGNGALNLSGNNTYNGTTTVNGGALTFSGTANIGAVTIADNATLGAKVTNSGTSVIAATGLSLGTSGTTSLAIDFNGKTNPTSAVIALGAGTLSRNGTINVSLANVSGLNVASNSLALLSYGSLAGSGAFSLLTTTSGHKSFSLNEAATALYLNVDVATNTWTGAASASWDTGTSANWSLSDQVFLVGDKVVFDDSATGPTSVDLAASVAPVSASFNNSAKDYTIGSAGGFGITSGSVSKSGAGALTISSSNSYSGGTTLNGGKLNVNNAAALGTGAVTINGGTLDNTSGGAIVLAANSAQNWNGDFAFAGSSDLNMGNGNVTLGGVDATRTVAVNGGTLTVGKITGTTAGAPTNFTKSGAGSLQLNPSGISAISGTLTVSQGLFGIGSQDFQAGGLAGSGTIQNGSTTTRWLIITNAADNTFDGSLQNGGTGALGLSKAGAGTLTLTGSNSYTDPTTINGGTLAIGGLLGNTAVNVNAGTLSLRDTGAITQNTVSISGSGALDEQADNAIGGTAALTFTGTSLTVSRPNSYSGQTSIGTNGGASLLRATVSGALGSGSIFIAGNGGSNRLELSGDITLANAIVSNGKGATIGQAPSILNVSGSNTLGGTMTVQTGGQYSTIQSDSGLLTLTAATALTSNAGGTRSILLTGSGDIAVRGAITNGSAAALEIYKQGTGTATLSGANSYTGATTVNGGVLMVTGSIVGSAAKVNSGATLAGTGALGAVAVNAGGTLAPGTASSTGILTATGSVTLGDLNGAAHLAIRIGSTTAGTGYDQVSLLPGSTLNLTNVNLDGSLLNGYVPTNVMTWDGNGNLLTTGDTFYLVIGASSSSGVFANQRSAASYSNGFNLISFGGQEFAISYNANASTGSFSSIGGTDIALAAVPEPSTWAMMVGGLGLLGFFQKSRRRNS